VDLFVGLHAGEMVIPHYRLTRSLANHDNRFGKAHSATPNT
jgi:hypothetical protein